MPNISEEKWKIDIVHKIGSSQKKTDKLLWSSWVRLILSRSDDYLKGRRDT